jgi:hypothetical protein
MFLNKNIHESDMSTLTFVDIENEVNSVVVTCSIKKKKLVK